MIYVSCYINKTGKNLLHSICSQHETPREAIDQLPEAISLGMEHRHATVNTANLKWEQVEDVHDVYDREWKIVVDTDSASICEKYDGWALTIQVIARDQAEAERSMLAMAAYCSLLPLPSELEEEESNATK